MGKGNEILERAKDRRRVFDQMTSMHFLLSDKYKRLAIMEDVVEICLSVVLCALTFFDFGEVIKGNTTLPVVTIGIISALLFAFTLVKQRLDRKKQSEKHSLAGKLYSRAKIELSNQISLWEASGYTADEIITYLEKSFLALNDMVQIPEACFARLKHAHQRKVEFSRFLDAHKAEPYIVCRLKFLFGIK